MTGALLCSAAAHADSHMLPRLLQCFSRGIFCCCVCHQPHTPRMSIPFGCSCRYHTLPSVVPTDRQHPEKSQQRTGNKLRRLSPGSTRQTPPDAEVHVTQHYNIKETAVAST